MLNFKICLYNIYKMSIELSGEDKAILYVNLHKFGGKDVTDEQLAEVDTTYNIPIVKEL